MSLKAPEIEKLNTIRGQESSGPTRPSDRPGKKSTTDQKDLHIKNQWYKKLKSGPYASKNIRRLGMFRTGRSNETDDGTYRVVVNRLL